MFDLVLFMRMVLPKEYLPFVFFIRALEKTTRGREMATARLTYIIKVATRFPVFSLYTGLDKDWKEAKNEGSLSAQF